MVDHRSRGFQVFKILDWCFSSFEELHQEPRDFRQDMRLASDHAEAHPGLGEESRLKGPWMAVFCVCLNLEIIASLQFYDCLHR